MKVPVVDVVSPGTGITSGRAWKHTHREVAHVGCAKWPGDKAIVYVLNNSGTVLSMVLSHVPRPTFWVHPEGQVHQNTFYHYCKVTCTYEWDRENLSLLLWVRMTWLCTATRTRNLQSTSDN